LASKDSLKLNEDLCINDLNLHEFLENESDEEKAEFSSGTKMSQFMETSLQYMICIAPLKPDLKNKIAGSTKSGSPITYDDATILTHIFKNMTLLASEVGILPEIRKSHAAFSISSSETLTKYFISHFPFHFEKSELSNPQQNPTEVQQKIMDLNIAIIYLMLELDRTFPISKTILTLIHAYISFFLSAGILKSDLIDVIKYFIEKPDFKREKKLNVCTILNANFRKYIMEPSNKIKIVEIISKNVQFIYDPKNSKNLITKSKGSDDIGCIFKNFEAKNFTKLDYKLLKTIIAAQSDNHAVSDWFYSNFSKNFSFCVDLI